MRMHFVTLAAAIGMLAPGYFAQAATSATQLTGSALLTPAGVISADGRFRLHAHLQPARSDQSAQRFALKARLSANDAEKSANTSCGPVIDGVFINGFE